MATNEKSNKNLYKDIITFLKETPGVRAKEIAASIGSTRTEVNQVLYSVEHKADFIQNDNYEWFLTPGITNPIIPKGGVYFLTNIDDLPEITIYKDSIDFADKLEYVNTAMLCMSQTAYVPVELQRHKDTSDFYIEIHKWQKYQKEYYGFICKLDYYDQEEGIRKRNYTDYLSEYSLLRLLGYHVGNDMPVNIRERVLMNCVFFNLIEPVQVMSHIDYLIKFGSKSAKESWENDLEFIKRYDNNIQQPTWHHLFVRQNKWKHESEELERQFQNEWIVK